MDDGGGQSSKNAELGVEDLLTKVLGLVSACSLEKNNNKLEILTI